MVGGQYEHQQALRGVSIIVRTDGLNGLRLTLKSGRLALSRLTSTLEGASIQKVEQNAVGQLLHVLIGKTGRSEFGEMVALGHVAGSRIVGCRQENNKSILVNPHEAPFPQKRLGKLDIDLANINGIHQARAGERGGDGRGTRGISDVLFLDRGAQSTNDVATRSGCNG